MRFSHAVGIDRPTSSIDLPEWPFTLAERDYQACAHGHRGIGMLGGEKRTGMINVESIGGNLLVQHYATRLAERDHVTMVSEASRAYVMHLVPVECRVVWDMSVRPDGPDRSVFECTIDVKMPLALQVLGYANGAPYFVRRHLVEETHGFAQDIAGKTQ